MVSTSWTSVGQSPPAHAGEALPRARERNRAEAKDSFWQALQRGIDQPYPALHVHLLLGPVKLLAQEGWQERAVALASLALHHPEGAEETREKAGLLLDELRAEMDPDAFEAAQERGRALDLEETTRALLIELEEESVA